MLQSLAGVDSQVDLARDLTLIGRVSMTHLVLFARVGSPYDSVEDVLAAGLEKPPVFGVSDIGGTGFIWVVIASELLGLNVDYLAGYPGTAESLLGLMRGDFDLAGYTYESVADRVVSADIRPLLQLSPQPHVSQAARLEGVPYLVGENGLATRRAREQGKDEQEALARAEALNRIMSLGRIVVAPPGLAEAQSRCLQKRMADVIADPTFQAAAAQAKRTLAHADAATLLAEVEAARLDRDDLASLLRRQVRRIRGDPSSD